METTQDIILQNLYPGNVEVKEYEIASLERDVKDILRVLNDVLNSPAKDIVSGMRNVEWRLHNLHDFLENICKDVDKPEVLYYFVVNYTTTSPLGKTKSSHRTNLMYTFFPNKEKIQIDIQSRVSGAIVSVDSITELSLSAFEKSKRHESLNNPPVLEQ